MVTKSVRLPDAVVEEVEQLRGDLNFTRVVNEALCEWLKARRRQQEDDNIEAALSQRSGAQRKKERKLAKLAADSSVRTMEKFDG